MIVVSLYCTIKYRPYTRRAYSNLECLSLIVTLLTIYFGIFFISDATKFEESDRTTKYGWTATYSARIFFFVVIIIANAVFLVYWVILIAIDLRSNLRAKHEHIYLSLCLCKNRGKLEKEKDIQRHIDQNEALRDDFMDSIRSLKKLYKRGKIVIDTDNIILFKEYLA